MGRVMTESHFVPFIGIVLVGLNLFAALTQEKHLLKLGHYLMNSELVVTADAGKSFLHWVAVSKTFPRSFSSSRTYLISVSWSFTGKPPRSSNVFIRVLIAEAGRSS